MSGKEEGAEVGLLWHRTGIRAW